MNFLFYHLIESYFQLTHLTVEHAVQHIFLLLKMVEVVEGKPCRFFLLVCLVHGAKVRQKLLSLLDKIFQK